VSDFWETQQRRKLTTFTSAMMMDNMKLLTMPKGKQVIQKSEGDIVCRFFSTTGSEAIAELKGSFRDHRV
jgi:hypothetical protein